MKQISIKKEDYIKVINNHEALSLDASAIRTITSALVTGMSEVTVTVLPRPKKEDQNDN